MQPNLFDALDNVTSTASYGEFSLRCSVGDFPTFNSASSSPKQQQVAVWWPRLARRNSCAVSTRVDSSAIGSLGGISLGLHFLTWGLVAVGIFG